MIRWLRARKADLGHYLFTVMALFTGKNGSKLVNETLGVAKTNGFVSQRSLNDRRKSRQRF